MEETLSCRSRSVKKVITAILLCMLLVTSAAPASVSATTNGKTPGMMHFNWICARGNEHWTYPYGETWCVSLIVAYYNWLGVGSVSGNAKDYAYNTLPGGWTRVIQQSTARETLQYGVQVHPLDGEITNPMQIILMVM